MIIRIGKGSIPWLVLTDILLLPYFNIIVMPLSSFYILWWLFSRYRTISYDIEFRSILVCVGLMTFSTCFGTVVNLQYGVTGDNIKRLIQYILAFGYYLYFKTWFSVHRVNLKKVLWCFVIFVLALGVIFQLNKSAFVSLTSMWNKGNAYNSSMLISYSFTVSYRYNFIWTDPNNIAYAITGVIMFMLLVCDTSLGEKIILFAVNVYILVLSMSSGGWIGFAISWFLYFIYAIQKKKSITNKISRKRLLFNIGIFAIVGLILLSGVLSSVLELDIVDAAIDRFENNENSRMEIWLRILRGDNILKYSIFGKGSELIIDGVSRAAHNGHIYWIYAFGFISYFIFMKKFFYLGTRNLERYIPMISFFLCFTMNTMVGEQKLLVLLIIIACYFKGDATYGEFSKSYNTGVQC